MSTPTPGTDRLHELLAARALDELHHDESAELERLLASAGDDDSFDLLAARLDQALAPVDDEPVPASVLASLHEAGERFLSEPVPSEPDVLASIAPPARTLGSLGWLAAAARPDDAPLVAGMTEALMLEAGGARRLGPKPWLDLYDHARRRLERARAVNLDPAQTLVDILARAQALLVRASP